MQTVKRITPEQEKEHFEKSLKDAVDLGIYPEKPQILTATVRLAIEKVADEYPNVKPASVKKAREVFASYFRWLTS